MNIEVYFHDNYVTSNEYKKVIVCIEKNRKYYLFGTVCNKQTNKIEVQRFIERDEQSARFLINGRKGFAKKYQDITTDELQIFAENISSLSRAILRFFQLNIPFDDAERKEIKDKVDSISNGENHTDWILTDLNQLTHNEIAEISHLISINGNTEGVVYKNKKYRLIEKNSNYVLQECCNDNATYVSENTDTEVTTDNNSVVTVRNFIIMAKIVNAENLADIVAGNFYPIVNEKDYNGKTYFIIDVNGNHKAVLSNRIKKINVFTEIP